jgi:hypothetical protein
MLVGGASVELVWECKIAHVKSGGVRWARGKGASCRSEVTEAPPAGLKCPTNTELDCRSDRAGFL